MKFQNYNPAANLSDIAEGAVYAFLVHTNGLDRLEYADDSYVQEYSHALTYDSAEDTSSDGRWQAFIRVCGVVVDKLSATEACKLDRIKVMFKTTSGDYVLNTYAVGNHNIFTNNMNVIPPATMIHL